MANRVHHSRMVLQEVLLVLTSFLSLSSSIRVYWNTNTGPIVPATSTIRPPPALPYRQPAPVWEIRDDIPNPNPYRYVLPPPSRPKPATNNYAMAPVPTQINNYQQQPPNYGQIISTPATNGHQSVPGLGIQYIPNVGFKYHAVAPLPGNGSGKVHYSKDTDVYYKHSKLNGKYNPKLKKYKAYDKYNKYTPYYSAKADQQHQKKQYQHKNYQQQAASTYQPQYSQSQFVAGQQINYNSPNALVNGKSRR